MSFLSEDEVLDTLTWSDESYTLAEFIDEHTLPHVVRVVRGYDGGTDSSTIGYGEIITLHALRETHKLTAEDSNGNAISIALDCPYKFNILPQKQDCSFNRCGVENLLSSYPKVKYLEVLQAHYATGADGEESTSVGERLEIQSIDKRQRKLNVKNIETEQTFMLPSSCSASFRPLLDWRSYCAKDLKTQFDFPTRVRFLAETESDDRDEKCHKLFSKTPDMNVVGEIEEVLVITTTVGSCSDMKFCYEIPSDLEIKVAVAEGFSKGERHYQDVVTNLEKGFDVTKFMNTQQPPFLKYRESIQQYDYACIPDLFLNISREVSSTSGGKFEEEAPALPPRRTLSESKSVPALYVTRLTPPVIQAKSTAQPPTPPLTSENNTTTNPKPEVIPPPRPRPKSVSVIPAHVLKKASPPNVPNKNPSNLADGNPNDMHLTPPSTSPQPSPKSTPPPSPKSTRPPPPPKSTPPPPSLKSTPPPPSRKPRSKIATEIESIPPGEPYPDLTAVSKTAETKPTPVRPSEPAVILPKPPPRRPKVSDAASEIKSSIKEPDTSKQQESGQPHQPPVTSSKVNTGWALPGLIERKNQPTHANERPIILRKRVVHENIPGPPGIPPRQSNNPEETPSVAMESPLDKPAFRPAKTEDTAPPSETSKLSLTPSRIPTGPTTATQDPTTATQDPTTATQDPTTATQDHGGERVLKEADLPANDSTNAETTQAFESTSPDDADYEELEPLSPPVKASEVPKQSETRDQSGRTCTTVLTGGSPGTGWETEDPYAAVARIPQELSGLSVSEVSQLLKNLRMGCYAERFAEEMIDGLLLKSLQEDDLQSLSVTSFHCKKLVKFINGWRPVQ